MTWSFVTVVSRSIAPAARSRPFRRFSFVHDVIIFRWTNHAPKGRASALLFLSQFSLSISNVNELLMMRVFFIFFLIPVRGNSARGIHFIFLSFSTPDELIASTFLLLFLLWLKEKPKMSFWSVHANKTNNKFKRNLHSTCYCCPSIRNKNRRQDVNCRLELLQTDGGVVIGAHSPLVSLEFLYFSPSRNGTVGSTGFSCVSFVGFVFVRSLVFTRFGNWAQSWNGSHDMSPVTLTNLPAV